MAVDALTATLLSSVLGSTVTRDLFRTIASSRIAEGDSLKQGNPDVDKELAALQKADLIGAARDGTKYYVTARGLMVARDLEKLPIG